MEECELPIWCFTRLTECTFMLPYFSVSVRVIGKALTCTLRLNLHMWARLRSQTGGEACRDKSLQTFLPRWFPYISGFTVSPPPLRLTVPLVWWQRFLVTERREERDWGPLLGRLCHFRTTAGQHVYQNMKKRLDSYRCGSLNCPKMSGYNWCYFWLLIFKQ